ncbi:hypothetical protein GGI43DRAFT_53538 [Trichoderma evansii]
MPNPHTCPYCGRNFKRPEHLRRHCRTHTKEKPFVCPCGAAFTRTDLLRRHEKLAHLGPRDPNDTHCGGSSIATLPGMDPPQASQGDGDSLGPVITRSTDAMGASEGQMLSLSDSKEYVEADSTAPVYQDPTFIDSMTNFESFIGGLGLPLDFISSPFSLNTYADLIGAPGIQSLKPGTFDDDSQCVAGPLPFSKDLYPQDRMQSRQTSISGHNYESIGSCKLASLEMTSGDIQILEESLRPFRNLVSDFTLPSLRTLIRHMDAWRTSLASHFPIIHFPTFQVGHCIPELILAMASLGALQTLEENVSKKLYRAARAIALHRLKVDNLNLKAGTTSNSDTIRRSLKMQSTQALVFLLIYSSWARDASVVAEGFELHSPLVQYMRACGFVEYDSSTEQNWIGWSACEAERRTKFLAFCFLNIHTLIYNRPPSLLSREIQLRLPCSTKEWEVTNELDWVASRQANICNLISFQDALESLVTPKAINWETLPCAFSNLILLHGVLQRIYLLRQLSFGPNLSDHDIDEIHSALFKWAKIWQRASGPDLHPSSEHGPIPFTSVAFLTLAYVRAHLEIGPNMWLATRDPIAVATALFSIAPPQRHSNLTSALLYAVHALSLPVAFGLEHVARSQSILWCCQHAACALESAVFLSKWLENIAISQMSNSLENYERHILSSVESVIKEALDSGDWRDTDTSSWCQGPGQMSIAVLKIWSKVFSEKSSWAITVHVGESLNEYAKICENSFHQLT